MKEKPLIWWLAIISNVIALILMMIQFANVGLPGSDEAPLVIALFTALILSLIALSTKPGGSESYAALWLRRKRLEEQARIAELSKEKRL